MYIESIELTGFRNFKEKHTFDFVNGKNLIYGLNGSGKSSILESIYILGFGKSFLNVKKNEILNQDSQEFFAKSIINCKRGISDIKYYFGEDFSMFINGKKTKKLEMVNFFFPVFFSSSNYTYYVESRSYTRKMINRFLFGIDTLFTDSIIRYGKILKQKKFLLKKGGNYSQLAGWNKIMSEKIFHIIKKRSEFIDVLNREIEDGNNNNGLKIEYETIIDHRNNNVSVDAILDKIESVRTKEIKSGRVLIGTHLDKIEIMLNGRHLKFFSSGEKKINLIIVYLAYIAIFKKKREEFPIFLIDDFDIAIDHKNLKILSEKYPEIQVIATSVNKNKYFNNIIKIKK